MSHWLTFALLFTLFADADVPRVNSLRQPANPAPAFSPGDEIPVLPDYQSKSNDAQSQAQTQTDISSQNPAAKNTPLKETSKLALIRYVSGEFAKAIKPLPAGKEGFLALAGKPIDQTTLDRAVATHGAAVNTGDKVQITKLDFRDHQIVVDVNGGGRGKKSWRDHIHIDMAGPMPTVQSTTEQQQQGPPGMQPGMGSTIFLEFNKAVPDLSADELKQLLAPFFSFAKERSAAVQWFDTLPPEMKKAIQERKPVVGMDREEVVAAVGKPEHKVRERDSDGNDIEDWIYGQPPSKTVFIRFVGDHVTSIKQFPQ
jgi:hypothetical protein